MSDHPNLLIAIGASAGGLKEIVKIVELLPDWFPGSLLIATHRTPDVRNTLVEFLGDRARVEVSEASDDGKLDCATIYIGSPNSVVEVDADGRFDVRFDVSRYARMHRIDDLFVSVAKTAGRNAVGVVLSGMLWDGTAGMQAIKEAGGRCIVQDPADADCDSMPLNVLRAVEVDFIGSTEEIASQIMEMGCGRSCQDQ